MSRDRFSIGITVVGHGLALRPGCFHSYASGAGNQIRVALPAGRVPFHAESPAHAESPFTLLHAPPTRHACTRARELAQGLAIGTAHLRRKVSASPAGQSEPGEPGEWDHRAHQLLCPIGHACRDPAPARVVATALAAIRGARPPPRGDGPRWPFPNRAVQGCWAPVIGEARGLAQHWTAGRDAGVKGRETAPVERLAWSDRF